MTGLVIGESSSWYFLREVGGAPLCENRKRCHQRLMEDTSEGGKKKEGGIGVEKKIVSDRGDTV